MGKKDDVADLLGEDTEAAKPAAKKVPAKKAVAKEEAKPAAKKAKAPPAEAPAKAKKAVKEEATERPAREPITFEEGERDELYKRIKKTVKKAINSRELAEKLEIPTRKLRVVLYSMAKREEIVLEPGESKVQGMTVSPA